MFSFILASGIGSLATCLGCSTLLAHDASKKGYVGVKKSDNISSNKKIMNVASLFIPGVNIFIAAVTLWQTGRYYQFDENQKSEFLKELNMLSASKGLEYVNFIKKRADLESLPDAMKLDGLEESMISQELSKAKKEAYSSIEKGTDKRYREIEAMSAAELWLAELQFDVTLDDAEKRELYSSYVKDFKKTNDNTKAKAPEKTLKMIYNRTADK